MFVLLFSQFALAGVLDTHGYKMVVIMFMLMSLYMFMF